jgi:Ca-activated chloride channel family protein
MNWWLLVPVLVAAWTIHDWYVRTIRRRTAIADRFAKLSRRSGPLRSAAALACGVLAATGLVFALLRPQALLAHTVPDYERQDLIVMLDRSVSMRAHDVPPSRFARATAEIRNFLRQKPDGIDRVGLVGFADASVILSYLTGDIDSISFYLDWIDSDPTTLLGTNLGAALASAREIAAKDDRATRKVFLLVSDGEDHGTDLRRVLATFGRENRRVNCVGIGSDDTVPIPLRQPDGREIFLRDDEGRLVMTKFSETTLGEIAASTGGRYVRSTTGGELASTIADIVKGERKLLGWRTTAEYRDLYPAGLAVAAAAGAALWLLL